MKKITLYIGILLVWTGLGSCGDFLDENPGTLTTQADLSSPEAASAFVTSIYANVNVVVTGSGGWGGNTLSLLEFMTGKADGVAQTEAFRFNLLTYDSQSFYIDTYWQQLFQGVLRCNVALEQLPRFSILSEQQLNNGRLTAAQDLIAKKPRRTYTDQKADLQEAEAAYLERVREVYLELATHGEAWRRSPEDRAAARDRAAGGRRCRIRSARSRRAARSARPDAVHQLPTGLAEPGHTRPHAALH
jgi:hypothetical protein